MRIAPWRGYVVVSTAAGGQPACRHHGIQLSGATPRTPSLAGRRAPHAPAHAAADTLIVPNRCRRAARIRLCPRARCVCAHTLSIGRPCGRGAAQLRSHTHTGCGMPPQHGRHTRDCSHGSAHQGVAGEWRQRGWRTAPPPPPSAATNLGRAVAARREPTARCVTHHKGEVAGLTCVL